MKILQQFLHYAPNRVFFAIILGILAGMSYSLLIPLMINILRPIDGRFEVEQSQPFIMYGYEIAHPQFAFLFFVICLFILLGRTISQVILARVATTVTANLRIKMYERIADAPVLELDRIGPSVLIAALTTDVPRIVSGARLLPDMLTNAVTLIGMLGFLFFLNPDVFWFVMGSILVGALTYQVPVFFGRRFFMRSRSYIDALQEAIRGLIYGAKELKLNRNKRAQYFADILVHNEEQILAADKWGQTIIRLATNYGSMLSFFVIGAISFVFVNYHAISTVELVGVIMALLYVSSPVVALLNVVPQLTVAQISARRVDKLWGEIRTESKAEVDHLPDNWQTIQFDDVTFQYLPDSAGRQFTLGPINLTIARGEVLFIVGGNGSGKSTLSKLITLHYLASEGAIRFDDTPVNAGNINAYRQHLGAIYSDYYLFDQLLGVTAREKWGKVDAFLDSFDLKKRVSFKDGRFSTLKLSDGQRRRLALLVALTEDKALYLFDEWAADQDPTFKKIFYYEILPRLKAQGKAVVVISHDDRYFDQADRIVVLEDGKIVHQGEPSAGQQFFSSETAPSAADNHSAVS